MSRLSFEQLVTAPHFALAFFFHTLSAERVLNNGQMVGILQRYSQHRSEADQILHLSRSIKI